MKTLLSNENVSIKSQTGPGALQQIRALEFSVEGSQGQLKTGPLLVIDDAK